MGRMSRALFNPHECVSSVVITHTHTASLSPLVYGDGIHSQSAPSTSNPASQHTDCLCSTTDTKQGVERERSLH